MQLIDTHTHLADPAFDPDREAVLTRASEAGVVRLVVVSETVEDSERVLAVCRRHAALLPAMGLYPTQLDLDAAAEMERRVREHRDRLAAIGEVGLDRWAVKNEGDRERQREIFARFIDLALELDLPLNVHSRSAGRHAVQLLLERGARRVQLHAFDGKPAAALPAVEAGYFFSVPPSVVRSRQKQKLVRSLPLSSLLLETDSPVLGPDPAVRNEPANIRVALETVAELKSVAVPEVAEAAFENTRRLYGQLTAS